jgi:hypothetical protein
MSELRTGMGISLALSTSLPPGSYQAAGASGVVPPYSCARPGGPPLGPAADQADVATEHEVIGRDL